MNEEIKVLIIEDEEMWATAIEANLNDFGFQAAGMAHSFDTAINLLSTSEFDIVLLDIHLNGRSSGIEVGKMIQSVYKKPFIFITSNMDSQTTAEAIKAKPSAYLTKPVNPVSLIVAIQNAINNFTENLPANENATHQSDFFFAKLGNKYKKINWSDVVYLRSEKNYTCIYHAPDKTEYFIRSTLPKTLSYIIPEFMQKQFFQLNRSEVVQLGYIIEFTGDEVKTACKTLSISENRIKELKEVLHLVS